MCSRRGRIVEFLGSPVQAEQLKAIGSQLSEERQKRSISLQEVAARTYIPLRLLNAIEAGRLDLLPEPVFIQGFIRRYADMLGLDGMSLSKEFSVTPPAVSISPDVLQSDTSPAPLDTAATTSPQADTLPSSYLEVEQPTPPDSSQGSEAVSKLPWIVGGVLGVGAIALLASLLNRPSPPKPAQNPVPATSASKAPATSPASAPATTAASSAPSPAASPTVSPEATGAVAVELSFTEDSWVEIQADGEVVFEGTLPEGTKRSWSGKNQVVISAGNAGAVSASYNKGTAKTLGALGDVTTTTFPPTAGQ